MTADLRGRVALVTGAAGGIGGAITQALASRGVRVGIVDLDKADLERVAAEIKGDVAPFAADLADDDQTAALPGRVREHFGDLDILVNNAGVRQIAPFLEVTPAMWRNTLDIDLTAPFVLSQAAIPGMLEKGRGKIINIASVAGELAMKDRAAYCSAKAGIRMLTKTITAEFGAQGIWCNAIAPGVVETPMTSHYFESEAMRSSIRRNAPMERWCQPPEIAEPVVFLCSEQSDYVNGTTLSVDGGWTAVKNY